MMEESDLVNLCWQNSLNPVTREEISCLVGVILKTINSIILGQSTISRKSNAGNCSAEPYKFSLPDSVIPKKNQNSKTVVYNVLTAKFVLAKFIKSSHKRRNILSCWCDIKKFSGFFR
jgi:hypothetical protein